MPKVLIREYDNSTTGFPASDNFAVVVPGYFGTPGTYEEDGVTKTYNPKDLLVDYEVYEVKSQKEFECYIGKRHGSSRAAKAPVLEELHTPDDTNTYNAYTKYLKAVTPADLNRYLADDNDEYIYKATEVTSSSDPVYGKKGHLHTTIEYFEKVQRQVEINGEPQWKVDEAGDYVLDDSGEKIPLYHWVDNLTPSTVTIKLTKITNLNDIMWTVDGNNQPISVESNFCIIKKGYEGSNELQDPHIGNQIAYELLGLGYTVLFKKMTSIWSTNDKGEPVELFNNDVLNTAEFWEPLKDKSVFNFRYVMTGGYYSASAMNQICALAKFKNDAKLEEAETYGHLSGRGDCIALCDIDENITNHQITANLTMRKLIENIGYAANSIQSNEYSAIFGPKVTYVMDDKQVEPFGSNRTFPASFHYLACAARTFERYNEWYAVAGYNRGVSTYSIAATSVKLGEIAINTLAPRKSNNYTTKSVNLILHERGNYYLWGNRTGYTLGTDLLFWHFLNIRQLCCSIKKQLYTACRHFTFDPNSDLLWINFVNAIKPTLEAMKADQGIKGYTISRVANKDNKKALLTARIRIVPIEAVEDFDISIHLEESLTGIAIGADETQA